MRCISCDKEIDGFDEEFCDQCLSDLYESLEEPDVDVNWGGY